MNDYVRVASSTVLSVKIEMVGNHNTMHVKLVVPGNLQICTHTTYTLYSFLVAIHLSVLKNDC